MLSLVAIFGFIIITYYALVRRQIAAIDPFTILFFTMVIYILYLPIAMKLSGDYNLSVDLTVLVVRVRESDWNTISLIGCMAVLATCLSFQIISSMLIWPPLRPQIAKINQGTAYVSSDTWTLVVATAVLILFFVSTQYENIIASAGSYEAAYTVGYENSLFSYLRSITSVAVGALANHFVLVSRRNVLAFIVSVGVFAVLSVLFWTKMFLVLAVLTGLCCVYRLGVRSKTVFLVGFLSLAVLGFAIILPVYAIYRGTGEISFDFLQYGGIETYYSDPIGPFAAVIYILQSPSLDSLRESVSTSPFWSSFFLWIPRSIWSERPVDISEAFARYVFLKWQPGYGVGFSPLAEGMLRFGVPGAIFVPVLTSAVTALLIGGFLRLYPRSVRIAVLTSLGTMIVFYTQRGPFSGLFTFTFQFFAGHLAVFKSVEICFWLARRVVGERSPRLVTAPADKPV